jgi:ADP-ribose pyrophosphatase
VDRWLWELPAGKIDNHESPDLTIVRELREEAGLKAGNWHHLGKIISSPGILDEVLHLYVAQDLSATGIDHELHEYIEVHWIDMSEAVDMAVKGEIEDAKSIINLIRAANFLKAR